MNGVLQILLYLVVLLVLAWPLGRYMARVYKGERVFMTRVFGGLERLTYGLLGIDPAAEMDWKGYFKAALAFSAVSFVAVFALQLVQGLLPLNPEHLGAVSWHQAFNTAVSFVTNTNWQSYGGETTMSYLTQMVGLAVQNFVSAAAGMAVLVAVIRGFARKEASGIGNFWVDITRSTYYVLLPLSFVLALVLVSQGVVQTFGPYVHATLIDPYTLADGTRVTEQTIAVGPAASQIAIKQLGTNGGGFFNVNSAHPLENPTPLANFLEMLSILIISAGLCFTFGSMVKQHRQGHALLATMVALFVLFVVVAFIPEMRAGAGPDGGIAAVDGSSGNIEGKEVRFGVPNSVLWAVATTSASNGSVNSMHDSFTPLGGLVPMFLMQLGEVVFGGVGSGLYGMLLFALLAVFIAGLMVGRTPEYLGKKVEFYDMKAVAIGVLITPLVVLVGTAVAVAVPATVASLSDPVPHGFGEVLYAYSSAGNNNGSAFAGLNANTPFFNVTLGIAMLLARFVPMGAALAVAGSLARKKTVPRSDGTFPTDGVLFVVLLAAVVLVVGGLSHFPALALGPLAEGFAAGF
jgi:potassium-transporting ATPase potassium-binding subunit